MKIWICYPPLLSVKGVPQLTQNRQFQWFSNPTYIYPYVPATAATLLKLEGHEVEFVDGIAQQWTYDRFIKYLEMKKPDLIAIETKTPIIRQHWTIINDIKEISHETKVVLMGDHVTALPDESLMKSSTDYIITGGDYDLALSKLARYIEDDAHPPSGLWYRDKDGEIKTTGPPEYWKNLDPLPFPDRQLTKAWLYYENWYKRWPFFYTMAGRDCWWRRHGGCSFCAWTVIYPYFRTRSPERHIEELQMLVEKWKVREVFDDTGTFPSGKWLEKFCKLMIETGLNEEILFSINYRFDAIVRGGLSMAKLMKKAGFRLMKLGLESASQRTLDMINKGITVEHIIKGCEIAKKAGLEVHLTIMVGYPWETREEALATLKLAKKLMTEGLADMLQSTVVVPYPGTQLWKQALENKWFAVDPYDYDRYDMKECVFRLPDMPREEAVKICDEIYKIFLHPKYILRRLAKITKALLTADWDEIAFTYRGAKAVLGHIKDFLAHHQE